MEKMDVLIKKVEDNVVFLTLNRPNQWNSLNRALFLDLRSELERMEFDESVSVVVISGQGNKAFCAGIDLKERAKMPKDEVFPYREAVIRPFFDALGRFPKPTIAAVNGMALGGGAEVALACDIRIASKEAKFAQAEIRWGMIPACGACQRLRMIVGIGKAKEIIYTGRTLEAREALEWGIYNRVVPAESLMDEARDLAIEIAKHSPVALRQAKKAIDGGAHISESLDLEFEVSKECYFSGKAMTGPGEF